MLLTYKVYLFYWFMNVSLLFGHSGYILKFVVLLWLSPEVIYLFVEVSEDWIENCYLGPGK